MATTMTPSTVQTSELTSMRTRLLPALTCSASQVMFPGSRKGGAREWLMALDLLMAELP
jgi:hypothetical protein